MGYAGIKAALEADRAQTEAQQAQLRGELDDIFAAAADVATDDEHDPEGSTIAYERSRTSALLAQAEAHLADIAHALERLAAGSYGFCERCGGPIALERLQARPVVPTCITCASR
jgi:RNA polymerase-binding transcription factor DksA